MRRAPGVVALLIQDPRAFTGTHPLNRVNLCLMDAWGCIRRLWSKLIACRLRGWDRESWMGTMRNLFSGLPSPAWLREIIYFSKSPRLAAVGVEAQNEEAESSE